ncbi:uncharacterized protein LOC128964506 [Oppia nitens]|uniref:uncharacterized protein LOC128964506 n=1 Tax=Oppia nitens TaxID=1686743 RepID=UPI0023DA6961|nr:uncharacterized protein LOC128964506 [Oppia nitens]
MANNTTELFGELSDNFFNYNDYSDDFANAPTPFIAYTDLNDIDTDDLVGIDNKRNIDTNNNSNNEIINLDFSINPNDSSYCVAIDEPMVTVESGTIDDQLQDVKHLECSTRKRRISYVDDDGEDSDVDSDNASIATAVTGKPKAKVGRKPSGVNKCMSRNAIAARENREKKKRESEDMRRKLNIALKDNKEKDSIIVDLRVNVAEKDKRIGYLEGLLANDSAIAAIIKHMSNVPTVQLIGSHFQSTDEPVLQKSDKMLDDKSVRKSTRIAAKGESAGICFHVNNNRMSLELCRKCSDSAKRHNKKGK